VHCEISIVLERVGKPFLRCKAKLGARQAQIIVRTSRGQSQRMLWWPEPDLNRFQAHGSAVRFFHGVEHWGGVL
jgi:hypothetical protein